MERRKRWSFTPEFKAEVVRLVREGTKSLPQVAKDLDLTEPPNPPPCPESAARAHGYLRRGAWAYARGSGQKGTALPGGVSHWDRRKCTAP
jgi:hypothetical protein